MKKQITRRKLLETGIKAGIILPFLSHKLFSFSSINQENSFFNSSKKLKILILGGTSFLGPHQVAYALSRGHSVATFTRGKTEPTIYKELFKNVERLIGDRENDLTALEKRKWDVVIDNSGRNVEWTKKSATLLKDKSDLYLYTSSTGVFYPYLGDDITEDTKVLLKVPENMINEESKLNYDYGVMKANSEMETINAFGKDRSIIVRPTYMIGPGDLTDRFIHWPVRLAKGGEILVPGKIDDPVQYIDVRDVAEWMIRLAENNISGTFNAVGPEKSQTMSEFVQNAQKAFSAKPTFVEIDDYNFLKENNINYLVPWIPVEGNYFGSARINNKKSIGAGLTFREIHASVKDTYNWWYSNALNDERRNKYELNSKSVLVREKAILTKWKKLNK